MIQNFYPITYFFCSLLYYYIFHSVNHTGLVLPFLKSVKPWNVPLLQLWCKVSPDELTSKIQQTLFEYILGITLKLIRFTVFNFNMETCFITAVDTDVCCVISLQFHPIYLLFVTKHKCLSFSFLKAFIWK